MRNSHLKTLPDKTSHHDLEHISSHDRFTDLVFPKSENKQMVMERRYSMKSRSSVMFDNGQESLRFIGQQAKVVQHLIQQFQLYVGYREQVVKDRSSTINKHAWGVYLMYVQSVHDAMKQTFQGKALFGDGVSPAIRIHLTQDNVIEPFDLPDPCLTSMISIRSFLAGIADHKLPSVELGNACMVELFNALAEIQQGRERLSIICSKLTNSKRVNFTRSHLGSLPNHRLSQPIKFLGAIKDKMRAVFDLQRCHA